jgi:hypothetical protein
VVRCSGFEFAIGPDPNGDEQRDYEEGMKQIFPPQTMRMCAANDLKSAMRQTIHDLKPARVKPAAASLIFDLLGSASLVVAIVLLFRLLRAVQQRAEASQTLSIRDIQPEQLAKLASTLARLSETDVEDLLASRGRLPETGLSNGSSLRSR